MINLLLSFFTVFTASANMNAILSSSEALEETTAKHGHHSGVFGTVFPNARFITVSDTTMFMGPAMNNLDGHLNNEATAVITSSGAPPLRTNSRPRGGRGARVSSGDTSAPSTGSSSSTTQRVTPMTIRHVLNVGFRLSETATLGPILDLSEPIQGSKSGNLVINDPQVRLSLVDVVHGFWGANKFGGNLSLTAYVPSSQSSHDSNNHGGLSISLAPRLHFAHSNFSFSGLASMKCSVMDKKDAEGTIFPGRLFAGIQANYRVSRPVHVFLMDYVMQTTGPFIQLDSGTLPAAVSNSQSAGATFGLMPGVLIRATDDISICPRANWTETQPLNTTTVGLNAMVRLI